MIISTIIALFFPWFPMGRAAHRLNDCKGSRVPYMLSLAIPFYLWVLGMALEPAVEGISYLAWAVLFAFFAYGSGIRLGIRERYGINGNMVEDFFAVMLLYPFAAYQMDQHMSNPPMSLEENGLEKYDHGKGAAYQNRELTFR